MLTKTRVLGLAIFILVGVVFLACSVVLRLQHHPVREAVTLNLGMAALAIVLVDLLWRVAGGNPLDGQLRELDEKIAHLSQSIEVIDRARLVGLANVYQRQGDFGNQSDWESLIRKARRSVDIAGRTAYGWARSGDVIDVIVRKVLQDRVAFRWLIMSRDNPYLPLLMEEGIVIATMLKEKLEATEKFLRAIHQRLG